MKVQTVLPTFFLVSDLGDEPWRLVDSIGQSLSRFELEEVVPCYDSVGIYLSVPASESEIRAALERAVLTPFQSEARQHEIPVCYSIGLDTDEVCERLSCSTSELIKAHSSLTFRCMAMGFSPGFGYLRPLEEGPLPQLWTLPRSASPRKTVPAGSVAITGRQAAVYPQATPGGWNLIGRTPLKMADLKEGWFRLQTGDAVTFQPIDASTFAEMWEKKHGEPLGSS